MRSTEIIVKKRVSGGVIAGSVLVAAITLPGASLAQDQAEGFFLEPSVSLFGVYDDNLLFDTEDEQSDFFGRLTPAVEAGFESERFTIIGNYTFDAENYADHSDLNSSLARRLANVNMTYLPNRRLTLNLDADYTNTNTPADLLFGGAVEAGLGSGLLLERQQAEQTSIAPEARYQFSPTMLATFGYSYTEQDLTDGISSQTNLAEASFEHDLSEGSQFLYGYRYREYDFSNTGKQITNTPWVGYSRALGPTTNLELRAGPRFNNDSSNPFISVVVDHEYGNGEIRFSYDQDEAAVLGAAGVGDSQTANLTATRRFGPNLELSFAPSYGNVEDGGDDVDILSLALEAYYGFSDSLSFVVSLNHSKQKGGLLELAGGEVTRNVILLGVTWRTPSRLGRQARLLNRERSQAL